MLYTQSVILCWTSKMNITANTRRPSEIFFTASLSVNGLMQIFNLVSSLLLIVPISIHRPLRTISNLCATNSAISILIFSVFSLIQMIFAIYSHTMIRKELCRSLSYLNSVGANAICYSYLVTAISQYFFNVRHRQNFLLTFNTHWFIIILSWIISLILPSLLYLSSEILSCTRNTIEFAYFNALDLFQHSSQTRTCSLLLPFSLMIFCYMLLAVGIPFLGIIIIYFLIVRHTRRIHIIHQSINHNSFGIRRDFRVVRHVLILVSIFGLSGLPMIILMIWKFSFPTTEPEELYLISILMVSFCTNIQISYILLINKKLKEYFRRGLRSCCLLLFWIDILF